MDPADNFSKDRLSYEVFKTYLLEVTSEQLAVTYELV